MEIFIIAAMTADGFIAKSDQQISTDWTSKEDAQFFRQKTREAGVIVMGSKTFATIGQPLPDRLNVVYTQNPQQFANFDQTQLLATSLEPVQLVQLLESKGYKSMAICGGSSIYTMFINSGLVTRLFLTTEPVLFGTGVTLFNQQVQSKLQLVTTHQLSEQTRVSEYLVVSS